MPKLLDHLLDDGTNRVNVICSRIGLGLLAVLVAAFLIVRFG